MSNPAHQPVALVTGASSGIGKAIAKRLVAGDYLVFGASRSVTANSNGGEERQVSA